MKTATVKTVTIERHLPKFQRTSQLGNYELPMENATALLRISTCIRKPTGRFTRALERIQSTMD